MQKLKNTKDVQEVTSSAIKLLNKGLITPKQAEKVADAAEKFLAKIPAYKKLKEADNAGN